MNRTTAVAERPDMDAFSRLWFQKYREIKAKYDAAETTDTNWKHWSRADNLSGNASASPEVRKVLRERARYECANNSYASGLNLTLAYDMIGTGPKLQFLHERDRIGNYVEDAFYDWCQHVGLTEKLILMKSAYERDGETFGVFGTNVHLETPVKLDIKIIETEQVSSPMLGVMDPNATDGVRVDDFGNPIEYDILKYHPGDIGYTAKYGEYETFPASQVLHFYTADRPGQLRGVSRMAPCLELFAQLRRATFAVMRAFEVAAMIAGVIYTQTPPDDGLSVTPFEPVDLVPGSLFTMPQGWQMSQYKSEQPVTTYKMFKDEILSEIGRVRNVPFNVIACRSDGYNYASGRLDYQIYHRSLRVEQSLWVTRIVSRIFTEWLKEAVLVMPRLYGHTELLRTRRLFMFDGHEHVDPVKEAQAQEIRLRNYLTTWQDEYAKAPNGHRDYQRAFQQLRRELDIIETLRPVMQELSTVGTQDVMEDQYDENGESEETQVKPNSNPSQTQVKPETPEQNNQIDDNVESIQDTAFNGAQVTAAIDILTKVSLGELPAETAMQMLVTFFQMTETEAANMVNPAIKKKVDNVEEA